MPCHRKHGAGANLCASEAAGFLLSSAGLDLQHTLPIYTLLLLSKALINFGCDSSRALACMQFTLVELDLDASWGGVKGQIEAGAASMNYEHAVRMKGFLVVKTYRHRPSSCRAPAALPVVGPHP